MRPSVGNSRSVLSNARARESAVSGSACLSIMAGARLVGSSGRLVARPRPLSCSRRTSRLRCHEGSPRSSTMSKAKKRPPPSPFITTYSPSSRDPSPISTSLGRANRARRHAAAGAFGPRHTSGSHRTVLELPASSNRARRQRCAQVSHAPPSAPGECEAGSRVRQDLSVAS
eukprot:163855-Prymnesium_polylepis.2